MELEQLEIKKIDTDVEGPKFGPQSGKIKGGFY